MSKYKERVTEISISEEEEAVQIIKIQEKKSNSRFKNYQMNSRNLKHNCLYKVYCIDSYCKYYALELQNELIRVRIYLCYKKGAWQWVASHLAFMYELSICANHTHIYPSKHHLIRKMTLPRNGIQLDVTSEHPWNLESTAWRSTKEKGSQDVDEGRCVQDNTVKKSKEYRQQNSTEALRRWVTNCLAEDAR